MYFKERDVCIPDSSRAVESSQSEYGERERGHASALDGRAMGNAKKLEYCLAVIKQSVLSSEIDVSLSYLLQTPAMRMSLPP